MPLSDSAQPRIYTIPPGQPFLDTLARALLSGDLPQPGGAAPAPLELARYTLLLPTRRAASGDAVLVEVVNQSLLNSSFTGSELSMTKTVLIKTQITDITPF